MSFVTGLWYVFNIALFADSFILLFDYCKDTKRRCCASRQQKKENGTLRELVFGVSAVSFSLIIFALLSYRKDVKMQVLVLLPVLAMLILELFCCFEDVGNILAKDSSKQLNRSEHEAICIAGDTIYALCLFGVPEALFSAASRISNKIAADISMLLLCVSGIAMLSFFSCALAIRPLQAAAKLILKRTPFRGKTRFAAARKRSVQWLNGRLDTLEETGRRAQDVQGGSKKIGWWIATAWLFIISVVLSVLAMILVTIVVLMKSLLCCLKAIGTACRYVANKLIALPDRKVVILSFRIAVLVALVSTVAINRYQPFLHYEQESTEVLEFVSSVLVIPFLLEWITSYKVKKALQDAKQPDAHTA